ncbi:MAG: beta-ketoacyl-[acyl-carrier-protein] synthase II [Planctomycetes bacterium]|nr:beta-ketoacyl-[acyl-carrier-protein] synthase II [Planctomycetota bacterium]
MTTRVHIAGRGAVTGYGGGVTALVDGVWSGRRAVRPRERTLDFEAPTSVAAEVPRAWCDAHAGDSLPLAFALDAARQALAEAGEPDRARLGLVLASTKGDLSGVVGDGDGLGQPARLARRVHDALGLGGCCLSVSAACASGLVALSLAARRVVCGDLDAALVVGVDQLCRFIMQGFGALHALDPEACRPFDVTRRGISLGEGAAAVLLTRDAARSVGVTLTGWGSANDAYHAIRPDPEGGGLLLATRAALRRAGLPHEAPTHADVHLLHLHGTGTVMSDDAEAVGLARLFGGATPPAAGSKGHTGHTLGAAGLVETLLVLEALHRGVLHGNAGLHERGVAEGLDVRPEARAIAGATRALKVTAGFGGVQAAAVFET